jgi:hypothetical protein
MKRVKVQYPASNENDWARGCPKCKGGIASAPELTRACELYMERLVQALDKQIIFCECKAGTRYRAYLLNRRAIAIEEVRGHNLSPQKALDMHPDIAAARKSISHSYEMARLPTIHWEPTP